MKKIGIILILIALVFHAYGQEALKEKIGETQSTVSKDTNENIKVVIGENLFSIEDSKDAVMVRVGNRGLNILESLEGPKFSLEKINAPEVPNQVDNEEQDDRGASRRQQFKGHWSGIEFGFNNFLTSDKSLVMPADIDYMTLHSGKSNNFNINFSQLSLGLTRHLGIVTGLGINWNNYRFDGNNNIFKGPNGIIEMLDPVDPLEKSKLTTAYLTLPAMLEIQIPADNHHLNIAAGFIGAIKLGSHTKMVFQEGDKVKSNGDFSLNMLRYGATARIGYQNLQIYGTYYMTPLFKTGKGPGGYDLFPFEIGLAFTFND
ncbi:MAG: hypothetical protein C0408_00880 [Odoribacter sp.]|nr:hypothetical protein [Odoribacter sp.]